MQPAALQLDPVSLDWLGAVVHEQRAQLVARWDAATLAAVELVESAPFVAVVAGRVGAHWYYATVGCAVAHARDRMLADRTAVHEGIRTGRVAARPSNELLPELTVRIAATEPSPPSWPALLLWHVAARWSAGKLLLERDTLIPHGPIAACPDIAALALAADRGFLLPVMSQLGPVKPLQLVGLVASEVAVARSWELAPIVSLLAQVDRNMLLGSRPSIIGIPEVAEDLGAAITAEVDPERYIEVTGLEWDITDEAGRNVAISVSRVWCPLLAALIRHRLGHGLPLRLVHERTELVLHPGEETGWIIDSTSDGERLVMTIARASADELVEHLAAGTPRIELAGVPLIVVLP